MQDASSHPIAVTGPPPAPPSGKAEKKAAPADDVPRDKSPGPGGGPGSGDGPGDRAARPPRTWGRFLRVMARRLAIVFLVLWALGWGASLWIDAIGIARPPVLTESPAIRELTVTVDEQGVRRIGDNWLRRRDGVMQMMLRGDAYSLGYANAAMSQPWLAQQETEFLDTVRKFVPSAIQQFLLHKIILLRFRDLPLHVSEAEAIEMLGLSEGAPEPHPEMASWAPIYHRVLHYHASHDMSHALIDHPLVGCTTFAAWGDFTADGNLIVGRNFDFAAARSFDMNKVVMRVEQPDKVGFVSVAWPGMLGAVTGMNDHRIFISINGVRSDDELLTGTPVSFVIRRVLQNATTLEEAVEILREATVFVSDLYLVAEGSTNRAVVVEKTPHQTHVREPEPDLGGQPTGGQAIVCANHFMTPALRDQPSNRQLMADGTTVDRYNRMETLLKAQQGVLTPRSAVDILRDRAGPDGREVGLGNEASLAPLIATHSVIADVTAGVLWVAASPYQLGQYVPFSIHDFEAPVADAETFPADPLMSDGGFHRFDQSQRMMDDALTALRAGDRRRAANRAREAAALNPDFYLPYLVQARLAERAGDRQAARPLYEQAHARYPAFGPEREEVRQALERLAPVGQAAGAGASR